MPDVSHGRTRGTIGSPHVVIDYDHAVQMQRAADERFSSSGRGIVLATLAGLAALFVCVVLPCAIVTVVTGSAAAGWVAAGVVALVLVLVFVSAWRSS